MQLEFNYQVQPNHWLGGKLRYYRVFLIPAAQKEHTMITTQLSQEERAQIQILKKEQAYPG